jgi:ChrB-like protein
MPAATAWLLLLYKVPSEPTARRVSIWRKLKRLGAILLHDAAWVLPDTPRTREQFQWLAAEIVEMGGEAHLWESRAALAGQDDLLTRQFVEQAEAAYQAVRDGLKQEERDLGALALQYQQTRQKDFFKSRLGQEVYQALLAAQAGDDK